jgi:ketosteroid isomerase-like protein
MYRIISSAVLAIVLGSAGLAQSASPTGEVAAIRLVLQQQREAWNRRDLNAFMQGYWNSPDLTFVSGAVVYRGWQAALDRYRKAYQSEGREMGTLDFSALDIEALSPDAAFVRGAFRLRLGAGREPHGRFTLIFRRFPQGWRIVHDHTCAATD